MQRFGDRLPQLGGSSTSEAGPAAGSTRGRLRRDCRRRCDADAIDPIAEAAAGVRVSLAGLDLRGIDLTAGGDQGDTRLPEEGLVPGVRLDGLDLRGAQLSGARLCGVSLRGAALDGALLVGADLRETDLEWSGLSGANLSAADLRGSNLAYADMRGASLLTADLSGAWLQSADLRDALLCAATLDRATACSSDFRWARLDYASLVSADLDGARFEGALLNRSDLTGAVLTGATVLRYAFLHGAILDGARLTREHVRGGIGESLTDLLAASATYRDLARAFEDAGRGGDAAWAARRAAQAATAAHRPDRARRYFPMSMPQSGSSEASAPQPAHPRPGSHLTIASRGPVPIGPSSARGPAQVGRGARSGWRALYYGNHAVRWAIGNFWDLATGHGTCARRIAVVAVALWLASGVAYQGLGLVQRVDGRPADWFDALRFSAAAMLPVVVQPLVAVSGLGRVVASTEALSGLLLLVALANVVVSRARVGARQASTG